MKIIKGFALLVLVVFTSCVNNKYPDLEDGIYADIQTNAGDILVELEYKEVPKTVANFVSLAEGDNPKVIDSMKGKPFYDGLTFHRVMSKSNGSSDDFMIQGGCPLANGLGDAGYKFGDEFPKDKNGKLLFDHNIGGVISMANSGRNTNGSQFFITIVPKPHLNGVHTVFGKVIYGFNLVKDSIKEKDVINKIDIIRVGKDAKNFDAPTVFSKEILKEGKLKEVFLTKVKKYKAEAKELHSGLKIYFLKQGDGIKPGIGADIRIHYAVFFTNGDILDTNRKEVALEYGIYDAKRDAQNGYKPFSSTYSMNSQLIQGFKEGLQNMRFGDRAMLFIPYHLAYGAAGGRGIPPKSDLIFELEMYPKEVE